MASNNYIFDNSLKLIKNTVYLWIGSCGATVESAYLYSACQQSPERGFESCNALVLFLLLYAFFAFLYDA